MAVYIGNRAVSLRLDGVDCIFKHVDKTQYLRYVSLGDSIAAGHTINAEWNENYGEGSQYGKNGNTFTAIVPNSYTDLIHKELQNSNQEKVVDTTSFARSGDTVVDLLSKLDHGVVREAISKAHVVTICIGANDVLQPAMHNLDEYINTGSLDSINAKIENNLATLNNDSSDHSYKALFDKLVSINPKAKYVFTTVYNPYKYLWIDEGQNGFFAPLLATIPQMNLDIDGMIESMFGVNDLSYWDLSKMGWVSIELDLDLDSLIKDGILSTTPFQTVFSRVNGLCDWSEKWVEGTTNFNGLNRVLRTKIAEQQKTYPNFCVAETKALFDTYPDRPVTADKHYNDLVSVEYTRGYDTMQMDWGELWDGKDVSTFWTDLAWKHLHFASYSRIMELVASASFNVWDYVSFDMNGFAEELMTLIVERVIVPDVDPHPEEYGHVVLKNSFSEAINK